MIAVVSSIADSHIEISPTKGVKASGVMAWAVLILLFIAVMFFISLKYGHHIKGQVKRKGGQIKSLFRSKK